LQRALARAGGNVSKAARDLDMSRATLHRKLKQLGLHR
jgi:transcriptional regulator of acetoin/glycerol metabolism